MCIACEIEGSYSIVDKDRSLCCFINSYRHFGGSVVPRSSGSVLGHLDPEDRGTTFYRKLVNVYQSTCHTILEELNPWNLECL